MKKEIYDRAELEIIRLGMTDVLANSDEDDEDELVFVPKH